MSVRNLVVSLIWLCLAFACESKKEEVREKGDFFSVNSMLDSQAVLLEKKSLLKKEGENDEILSNSPDWKSELQIFRSFEINKPVWKDAFRVRKEGNSVIYTTDSEKINVKQIKVLYNEGKIAYFSGIYIDENLLYRIEKNVFIKFENGIISTYRLHGKQKIVFRDEFEFKVDCRVKN